MTSENQAEVSSGCKNPDIEDGKISCGSNACGGSDAVLWVDKDDKKGWQELDNKEHDYNRDYAWKCAPSEK